MDMPGLITILNAYGFTDSDTPTKVNAAQGALRSILYRKPWPFLEAVKTIAFNGSSAVTTTSLTDMRAVMKIMDLSVSPGRRVRFRRTDDAEEQFDLTLAGLPFFYYFVGTQLNIYQIPSSTQTLRLRYLRKAPVITETSTEADVLLPADYHQAWEFLTVSVLADLDDDNDVAARFEAKAENQIAQMTEALFALQHDEPEYVHVIDIDDYGYDD
jgi:hypothetical protein